MTPHAALVRVGHLLALAARDSGASEEEARTAGLAASRLISEHHLLDRSRAVDLALVTRLSLRVLELERLLRELAARAARSRPDIVPSPRRRA